jgi:hypothetical protein
MTAAPVAQMDAGPIAECRSSFTIEHFDVLHGCLRIGHSLSGG